MLQGRGLEYIGKGPRPIVPTYVRTCIGVERNGHVHNCVHFQFTSQTTSGMATGQASRAVINEASLHGRRTHVV